MWMTLLTVFENCPKNLHFEHFDKLRLFLGFSTTLYEPNKSKTMSFFIKILIEYLYQNQLLRYMTEMID